MLIIKLKSDKTVIYSTKE